MNTNTHPLLHELSNTAREHGIGDDKAYLAFETYMELCEVHKLWEVRHHYSNDLKMFYITGKAERDSEQPDAYVPVMSDEVFTLDDIENLQVNFSPIAKSVVLAFKDRDSSSTYYRVGSGLTRPESPRSSHGKKSKDKERAHFMRELQRNRKKLFTQALESQDNSNSD